jgi:uncharacterized OsmC-like protein
VVRRIVVRYHLPVKDEQRDAVRRVLEMHVDNCPVARTLRGCVAIETEMEGLEG